MTNWRNKYSADEAFLLALALLVPSTLAQPPGPRRLAAGQIASAQRAAGAITLDAGQAVDIELQQYGRNLSLEITLPQPSAGPGDKLTVDLRETGPEKSVLVAEVSGTYRFAVLPVEKRSRPSRFQLTVGDARKADERDPMRIEAQRAITAARLNYDSSRRESVEMAAGMFEKAQANWRSAGDLEAAAAASVHLATIRYFLGEQEKARALLEAALPVLERFGSDWALAEGSNNLGSVLWQLGEFERAQAEFHRARTLFAKVGQRRGEAAALNNLALLSVETGSYQEARRTYRRGLEVARTLGEPAAEAFIRYNLGAVYHALGEDGTAMSTLRQSRDLFAQAGLKRAEGRAWLRMAEVQFASTSPSAAAASLVKALELSQAAGDRRTVADVQLLRARVDALAGRVDLATASFSSGLEEFDALKNPVGKASALYHRGVFHLEGGRLDEASRDLESALALRRSLGMRDAAAAVLHRLAILERKRQSLPAALARINGALAEAEVVRSWSTGQRDRILYMSSRRQYYALAVSILMELHQREPEAGHAAAALDMAERAKARALLESVLSPARASNPGLEQTARALSFWSYRLSQTPEGSESQRIRSRIQELVVQYNDLEGDALAKMQADRVKAAEPTAGSGVTPDSVLADAAEMRRELTRSGASLLHYFLDSESSWVWVATANGISARALPPRARIERLVRRSYATTSAPGQPAAVPLAELARTVLWPAMPPGSGRMVICPDGALHRVPFGALPVKNRGAPLATVREVVIAPSASLMVAWRNLPEKQTALDSRRIAIVADPVFDAADARLGSHSVRGANGPLRRLAFTRSEAAAIQGALGRDDSLLLLDFEASKQQFTTGRLGRFPLLHIASHALVDRAQPELSALALSMQTPGGKKQDGFLRVHEIARLQFNANVIALSACGTGLGAEVDGEGPLSLARAFLQAGARSVLVSLWNVEDEATSVFMRAFYRDLTSRRVMEPARSLRYAQLQVRQDPRWNHPYYWAGWVIAGDWN